MFNRHLSLNLALRYLNPLRTYFSIITLICLIGVSLGVMVLIVVLSIMSGLVKDVQDKVLAFSPHIQILYTLDGTSQNTISEWEPIVDKIADLPGVESAYAQIEDIAMIDYFEIRRPCFFRAIDTENEKQMAELQSLIKTGSFDLDLGEKVVLSSTTAESLGATTGNNLRALTLRNLNSVIHAYNEAEKGLLAVRFPEQMNAFLRFIESGVSSENGDTWSAAQVKKGHELAYFLISNGRISESELIADIYTALDDSTLSDNAIALNSPQGTKKAWLETFNKLKSINKDEEDLKNFLNIRELILPKDLEILGIYQTTQHVASPDLFIPLNIGQELLGYEYDEVQTIAVRVKDPYILDGAIKEISSALPQLPQPAAWKLQTWQDKYSDWFALMHRERVMMNFVLSVISLISAFCIMAVMFTVAMQRKKELAVVKSLGATPAQLIRIFLWQGVIIGALGSILGVLLGILVLHYRKPIHGFLIAIGFDPFPVDFHGVEMPAEINPQELVIQAVKAFFMVVAASVIPAVLTAYQDPAKALRSM